MAVPRQMARMRERRSKGLITALKKKGEERERKELPLLRLRFYTGTDAKKEGKIENR